jgi:NADH-quinone oxidoreductase subunit N
MDTASLNLVWEHILPELLIIFAALLITFLDAFVLRPSATSRVWYAGLSVLSCGLAALYLRLFLWDANAVSFGDMFVVDNLAVLLKMIILLGAGLSVLLTDRWLDGHEQTSGGFHALILLSVAGMMFFVSAADLVLLFLGLELMSIPIYVLAASDRNLSSSVEAGLKYLILGSFATGIFLFGLSLLYGWAGTTNLELIRDHFVSHDLHTIALIGVLLTLVGLAFKISAVPFHMWTPDVYEGAPTPVTAFMAACVKAASFGVLIKIFAGPILQEVSLSLLLQVLAALTMIVGNVAALAQNSVKRMLAYSSVAHAGYLLLGVLAGNEAGTAAVLFYALGYTLMTIASFGVLVLLSPSGSGSQTYDELRGIGRSRPWVAVVMTVAMLSLIGLPPTMGFIGKFYLFRAAVEAGFVPLAVLGVLASAVSLGYYLRVVLVLWFEEAGEEPTPVADPALVMGLVASAIGLIVAGLLPGSLLSLALEAVGSYY